MLGTPNHRDIGHLRIRSVTNCANILTHRSVIRRGRWARRTPPTTCPGPAPGALTRPRVSHSKLLLYGAFVWVCRVPNSHKRRFPVRAEMGGPSPTRRAPRTRRTGIHPVVDEALVAFRVWWINNNFALASSTTSASSTKPGSRTTTSTTTAASGAIRVRSCCRSVRPFIHFIPGLLI